MCNVTIEMYTVVCCACDRPFQMTKELNVELRKNGNWFYCPWGHQQHYSDSENDRLKKRIVQLEKELTSERNSKNYWMGCEEMRTKQRDALQRQVRSLRGRITRLLRLYRPTEASTDNA